MRKKITTFAPRKSWKPDTPHPCLRANRKGGGTGNHGYNQGNVKAEYLTFSIASQGLYKDRGSRFISYAYPVRDSVEIEQHLHALRQEHHAARHICHAYILGSEGLTYRADDNGEPSSTGGKPILDALRRAQLTYALIAVVRYFGGVKLGVPGLIQAYRMASEEAIKANNPVVRYLLWEATVRCDYDAHHDVLHRLLASGGSLINEQYTDAGSVLRLTWPLPQAETARSIITDLRDVKGATVTIESETVIE